MTRSPPDSTHQRREWLTTTLRWLALGGLGVLAAVLGLRRQLDGSSAACLREQPCGRCGSNGHCELPRAAAWRDSLERKI